MAERTVTVRLRATVDAYKKAMQDAAGATSKFAAGARGDFTKLGDEMKQLGDKMTRNVTLPLAAIGVGATKLSSDFEMAFAQMVGLAGVPADEVDRLRDSVLRLSSQTARSPQELAEALYYVRSSGVSAAKSIDVLEMAAKGSAAGLGSTGDIAKAVGFALNAYGEENLSAAQATDILVSAVREGTIEASDLAPVMGRLIPTASALGISFADVAGTLAVMSRTGLDAEEAATSLSATFGVLLGTSKAGEELLAQKGMTLKQLRDIAAGPGGTVAAMRALGDAFAGDDEALSTIIPNVRAFRAFMNVLAQDGAKVDSVMRNVRASTGALDEAFKAVEGTKAFEIKQSLNEAKIALVQLGAALAPFVVLLAGAGAAALAVFGKLPDWLQGSVAGFLLLLAAVGPVTRAAGLLIENFRTIASAATKAFDAAAIGAYNAAGHMQAVTIAAGVVGIALAGIAALWINSAQKTAEAEQRVRSYADAIRMAGSVAAGASSELAKLLGSGKNDTLLAVMAAAGVSVDQLAAAAAAGGDQFDALKAKLIATYGAVAPVSKDVETDLRTIGTTAGELAAIMAAGGPAARSYESRISALSEPTQRWFANLLGLRDTLNNTSSEIVKGAARAGLLDTVLGVTATTSKTTSDAIANIGASVADTDAQIKALIDTFDRLYGAAFDVLDAQIGYADALDEVERAATSSSGSTRNLERDQRSLKDATKDLTKAQQELQDAEAALAEARKGPTARQKQDASIAVRDAALNLAESQKAVADAQKRVNEERKKGKEGDVKGALLQLQRAQLALEQSQLRMTDAQAAQNEVLNSGSESSKTVKDALDNVADAQDRVEQATYRVMDAEATLRGEGASGGAVADRHRAVASALDKVAEAGKKVIEMMIAQGKPAAEVIKEIDAQRLALEKLIEKYGDANGKLKTRIDLLLIEKVLLGGVNLDPYRGADAIFADINKALGLEPRAVGGPVTAGRAYMVGERGPEMFVPSSSGSIVPNGALYSGAAMSAPPIVITPGVAQVVIDGAVVGSALIRWSRDVGGAPIKIRP